MSSPWLPAAPVHPETLAVIRRRAIFDCCKWDPQVGDTATVSDTPIVLTQDSWREIAAAAEALAHEAQEAEDELVERPDLHAMLGLPAAARRSLRARGARSVGIARLVRFDFHYTTGGWRISEANTDVPGGLNEASGLGPLLARHVPGTSMTGDVAAMYARALTERLPPKAHVALVHATAYTDDRQVMVYVARRLNDLGVRTSLISPAHLRWQAGRAVVAADWCRGDADALVRFFPAEWLPNLPMRAGATHFFRGASTAISNPATALLTQSKRFALTWPMLRTRLPTWQALLPETRDPRDAAWQSSDEWVLKPALGRVGEDIGIRGVTPAPEWRVIARDVARHPERWIAQRRFDAPPMVVEGRRDLHPCVGVYTVDGHVAGAYGRLGTRPLIDGEARDAAVLVDARASISTMTVTR